MCAKETGSSIEQVQQLALRILEHNEPSDEALELLERYVGIFGVWYDQYQNHPLNTTAEALQKLSESHGMILDCARRWKLDTAGSLAANRRKGKGMRAYVDTLPRRISFKRTRKG